ncbi:MAG TPA: RagB/SusD family nutrient uptake outer membrane protein, partial [Flavobacteriaceae bacterium]|nr:RagB/SusD family nutrient uptake outer membrane protein [Flavobacteriaceae bacterium]
MKRNMIKFMKPVLATAFLSLLTVSCTDLAIEESDSIIAEGATVFEGVADVDASITNLYNDNYGQLGDQGNFFALNEVSTDETLVPTRGTDWGDNGIWRTLHAHTWSPTHQYVLNTWNNLNQNVLRATQILDPLSAPNAEQEAQARFLRAFSMYFVLDLYGVAPFRQPTDDSDVNPSVLSASEAYDFIVNDLETALPNLPMAGPGPSEEGHSRANRAAGHFMLAKVILNSERYTGSQPNYQAVIDHVDAIAGEGYALQAGYFDIFKQDVPDSETIWYAKAGVGNRIWNGLHYNQNSPDNSGGGWNGFTTLAEFYDSFEGGGEDNSAGAGQEERRGWVPGASDADSQNL